MGRAAARSRHIHIIEWMHNVGHRIPDMACADAANRGWLDIQSGSMHTATRLTIVVNCGAAQGAISTYCVGCKAMGVRGTFV